MAAMVERTCECCRKPFTARAADVRRGWARFCSKSCKASDQERRTHQFAEFQHRDVARALDDAHADGSWDEHKIWGNSHD